MKIKKKTKNNSKENGAELVGLMTMGNTGANQHYYVGMLYPWANNRTIVPNTSWASPRSPVHYLKSVCFMSTFNMCSDAKMLNIHQSYFA